jgi:hypothetical protein
MIGAIGAGMAGMERQAARLERSATRTAAPAGGSDPVAERAEQIGAQHAYSASAAVVRTGDQMIGSLLDIVA